jgi:hypothetical protein
LALSGNTCSAQLAIRLIVIKKERTMGANWDEDRDDNPGGAGYSERDNRDGGGHHTLYDHDTDNHISWDTDRDGDYIPGSGHEDRDGSKVNDWD